MTSYVHDNEFPSVLIKEGTVPASPASGDQRLYVDSTSHHLKRVNSSGTIVDIEAGGGTGLYTAYLCYQDQKAQNTEGGTFTSGAWQTRTLTTEVADTANHGVLASNQITLDAGTYTCKAYAPAFLVDRHQCRLQNITDGATIEYSQSADSSSGASVETSAVLVTHFTIAGAKVLELQHQCQTTRATNGFGLACNFGPERYSAIEFWKE